MTNRKALVGKSNMWFDDGEVVPRRGFRFRGLSRMLQLLHLVIIVVVAVLWTFTGMSMVLDDLAGVVDASDPTNGGFWNTENRESMNVFASTSGVSAVNGVFRSIGKSGVISLRSDSFRALTITIR